MVLIAQTVHAAGRNTSLQHARRPAAELYDNGGVGFCLRWAAVRKVGRSYGSRRNL